jgi:hypothetical protein
MTTQTQIANRHLDDYSMKMGEKEKRHESIRDDEKNPTLKFKFKSSVGSWRDVFSRFDMRLLQRVKEVA